MGSLYCHDYFFCLPSFERVFATVTNLAVNMMSASLLTKAYLADEIYFSLKRESIVGIRHLKEHSCLGKL